MALTAVHGTLMAVAALAFSADLSINVTDDDCDSASDDDVNQKFLCVHFLYFFLR